MNYQLPEQIVPASSLYKPKQQMDNSQINCHPTKPEFLFNMVILLGEGQAIINVLENDDPKYLARKFCLAYDLSLDAEAIICKNLKANLETYQKKLNKEKYEIQKGQEELREQIRPCPSNHEKPKQQLNENDRTILAEIDEVINNISVPLIGNISYQSSTPQIVLKRDQEISVKSINDTCVSIKSNLLLKELQSTRLQQIFKQLDSDNDGYISYDKIDLTRINDETLRYLEAFLVQMEANKDTYNYEEYFQKVIESEPLLTLGCQRKILLHKKAKWEKKRASYLKLFSFHPQLCHHSIELMKNHLSGDELYEQLYKLWDRILKKRKNQKDENTFNELLKEMLECSFKPQTNQSEQCSKMIITRK